MTGNPDSNLAAMRALYDALESRDLDGFFTALPKDIDYRLCHPRRELRAHGSAEVEAYFRRAVAEDHVSGPVKLERLAVDGDTAFAMHVESEGTPGEHRHILVVQFADGRPKTIWELTLGGPVNEHGTAINMFQEIR